MIEATTRLVILEQSWRIALERVPTDGVVRLPLRADPRRLGGARLRRRQCGDDPRDRRLAAGTALRTRRGSRSPARRWEAAGGIEIDLSAGWGATVDAAPAPLVQAIRLLAAHWFENRGDGPPQTETASLPLDVAALIAPFRRLRMG